MEVWGLTQGAEFFPEVGWPLVSSVVPGGAGLSCSLLAQLFWLFDLKKNSQ